MKTNPCQKCGAPRGVFNGWCFDCVKKMAMELDCRGQKSSHWNGRKPKYGGRYGISRGQWENAIRAMENG